MRAREKSNKQTEKEIEIEKDRGRKRERKRVFTSLRAAVSAPSRAAMLLKSCSFISFAALETIRAKKRKRKKDKSQTSLFTYKPILKNKQ